MKSKQHPLHRFGLAFAGLLLAGAVHAAEAPQPDLIATPLAKEVVRRAIELVEANALPPRDRQEYTKAKDRLLAALDAAGDQTDRRLLFQHVNAVLWTLDVDRHSFISAPARYQQVRQAVQAASAAQPASFASIETAHGKVLHWTPPQSMGGMEVEAPLFLKRFMADAAALPSLPGTCALVVDLSAQRGGNAWPPFAAMHPLFSAGNTAVMVDRDGRRQRYVHPQTLAQIEQRHGGQIQNPLRRFAGTPVAVVVGENTSSAGEMLLIALMGESARIRTFGATSHGFTTANMTYPLADGSTLVLTERRYALGDGPVIRGGIPAQVPAAAGAAVAVAAEWVAAHSPLCKTRALAAADGQPAEVRTLDGLPAEVRTLMRGRFGEIGDAGAPFSKYCMVGPGEWHQRFQGAAASATRVKVRVERGGLAYSSFAIDYVLGQNGWEEDTKTMSPQVARTTPQPRQVRFAVPIGPETAIRNILSENGLR